MEKECIEVIVGIIEIASAILVLIGASMGLSTFHKWRVMQLNATFNFYARLKTKLKIISDTIANPVSKKILSERLLPEIARSKDAGVYSPMQQVVIDKLANLAESTIEFFMTEDNQMPISEKWNKQLDTLLEFLQDCESLKDESFFKWTEKNKDIMDEYFRLHSENLMTIINDISNRQTELTEKYLKKK